jgi:hypothetical protein
VDKKTASRGIGIHGPDYPQFFNVPKFKALGAFQKIGQNPPGKEAVLKRVGRDEGKNVQPFRAIKSGRD